MTPATYDMTMYQGATFRRTWVFPAEFGLSTDYGQPRMQIRRTPTSRTILWQASPSTLSVSGNNLVLEIPAHVNEAFEFSTAGYDIELPTTANPELVYKIFRGEITLIKEYTKDLSI